MATIERFEDLEVWQLARKLCQKLEHLFLTTGLGKRYSLFNQMDRSSGSVMDTIAEGFGRSGNLEFRNFLGFAKGSCSELKSQLHRSYDKGLIQETDYKELVESCDAISAKLGSFISYLSRIDYKGVKFKQ